MRQGVSAPQEGDSGDCIQGDLNYEVRREEALEMAQVDERRSGGKAKRAQQWRQESGGKDGSSCLKQGRERCVWCPSLHAPATQPNRSRQVAQQRQEGASAQTAERDRTMSVEMGVPTTSAAMPMWSSFSRKWSSGNTCVSAESMCVRPAQAAKKTVLPNPSAPKQPLVSLHPWPRNLRAVLGVLSHLGRARTPKQRRSWIHVTHGQSTVERGGPHA